ncbi:MAG: hypothetical protein JWO06_3371 [Bacteroidota bacterium]|nr:hypothetical protein [Bacteroidota bacterium]
MESNDFRISLRIIWAFIGASFLLIMAGVVLKIIHLPLAETIILLGLFFFFLVWIAIVLDVYNNNIRNKFFWLLSLFVFPYFALIIYLVRRKVLRER